jgi:hypothetical protein
MTDLDPKLGRMLALSSQSFEVATIENASELIAFANSHGLAPVEVDDGYGDTIRIFWPRLEIEVFEDRLEIHPEGDRTRTRYEDHRPGEGFSAELLEELRR